MRLTQLPELLKPPLTWLGFGCAAGVFTVLLRQPKTALWLPALFFPSAGCSMSLDKPLPLVLALSMPQWGWECSPARPGQQLCCWLSPACEWFPK